ncbi:ornithine cyclodeaminase family protein [Shouchella patagoniensis]|uniref:ornithine cyclodeaminase family protein n=1 Tax=Shouchella patagoniensis TaxID=228576 RepID=UPI0009951614|nr:ornithine cyclodeaminase [Shouchella patagoniensis]
MKILTKSAIESLYKMEDCLKDIEEAFLVNRNAKTPVRTALSHQATNGTSLYMPAYSESLGYSAIKMVSVFPDNPRSGRPALRGAILLTDTTTGEHVALMDASYLTILRTGASSGVATKYLAKADAHTLSVIGTGAQAIGQIQAVLAVRDINTIYLYNRTHEKAQLFAENMRLQLPSWNGDIVVVESVKEAVEACDILVCSTKSNTPVFDGNDLKSGTHINGIGSFQATMQEVDVTTLNKSSKIVVDTQEGAQHEAGDLLIPIEDGTWNFDQLYSELAPILAKEKPGRENDEEITFYKSVGVAYLDTAIAVAVYHKAVKASVGEEIALHD